MFVVPLEATFISENSEYCHWQARNMLLAWTIIISISEKRGANTFRSFQQELYNDSFLWQSTNHTGHESSHFIHVIFT